jgi:hypothetical protein
VLPSSRDLAVTDYKNTPIYLMGVFLSALSPIGARCVLGSPYFQNQLPVASQFDGSHEFSSWYSRTATLGYLPAGTPRCLERSPPLLSRRHGEVTVDRLSNVNDFVELLASLEDTVGRVVGVRDSGTRIRVLWERRRGYEGQATVHDSSALRKILPAAT